MSAKADDKRRKRRADAQAKSAKKRTAGQTAAMVDLQHLVVGHERLLSVEDLHVGKGRLHVRLRIRTENLERVDTGLPISGEFEDVELRFDDSYPNRPPLVVVAHPRFIGHPHVLIGFILCIYLDLDREWHPGLGMTGVVNRLVEWFADAAADRFDPRAALYHPIGGLHPTPVIGGTLVVRHAASPSPKLVFRATVVSRTAARCDLVRGSGTDEPNGTPALVVRTLQSLPLGLIEVRTLGELAGRIERAAGPTADRTIDATARLVASLRHDDPIRILVEVAHPSDPTLSYLACAVSDPPATVRPRLQVRENLVRLPIGWLHVSDERPTIATRRDSERPTAAFAGKAVEIWGCGGLGSWIAEFVCRAGARRLTLRDTGTVQGGLLVRQNYVESDIGMPKAVQLAARLDSIADDLEVVPLPGSALDALSDGFTTTCDVLIDATINVTVAARLDEWARTTDVRPLLAQVATDPGSATLGMLIVASPDLGCGPASIDDATWAAIGSDPSLEQFHGFWTPVEKSAQIVPALGCSTPTFHGSAADLAALAGSLVSLLGPHIGTSVDGTHLIESSHARGPHGGGHHFVPFSR